MSDKILSSNEKAAPASLNSEVVEVGKVERLIDDEAGSLATRAIASGEPDPAESKEVLKKIDWHILPFLCVTYGLMYLDKSTLSSASIFGIIEDDNLVGQDYAWASSIFYFAYLFSQYPGSTLLQRFPIAKALGGLIVVWGIILMCTAATSSFAGLAVTRWFLGMTEASINPGFITITAMWYTRHEQASRSALWITMICVFTIFGSVLTYGLGSINGTLSTWKWIYLVLGALTIVWGALWLWCVPDNPATASWLSEAQRIVALQRIVANQTGTKSRQFVKAQMIEALLDVKVWLIAVTVMANTLVGGALTFQSIIMADLGFDNLQVALLNMPYGALGTLFALAAALVIHYVPNSRLLTSAASMLPAIAGTLMIKLLPHDLAHAWTRMVGVWLLASWNNGFFIMLGLIGPNIAGSTKRTTANTIIFVFYCLGPIIGTQLFPDSEAPAYQTGLAVMLGAFCVHAALNVLLRFVYMWENHKRDRSLEGLGIEELEEMRTEGLRNGFEDVTDVENRMFRYVY